MSSTVMDPADAAGGIDEVEYSSDNVEAIQITKSLRVLWLLKPI